MSDAPMRKARTKAERDDLVRLVKQRERVAKTAAEQRSAAMLCEFEQQIAALHAFNSNDVWKAATEAAIEAGRKANEAVMAEADRLGIPREFQPKLHITWARRGENEYSMRREELRRVAKAEIAAMETVAFVQIEMASVQAQTEVIAHGLSSPEAIAFLNSLPAIESMMPPLDVTAIQHKLAEKSRKDHGGSAALYLINGSDDLTDSNSEDRTGRPTIFTTGLGDVEWHRLPLRLRMRWWRETKYGTAPPSQDLVAAIRKAASTPSVNEKAKAP